MAMRTMFSDADLRCLVDHATACGAHPYLSEIKQFDKHTLRYVRALYNVRMQRAALMRIQFIEDRHPCSRSEDRHPCLPPTHVVFATFRLDTNNDIQSQLAVIREINSW